MADLTHNDVYKPGDVLGYSGNGILSGLINFGTYGIPGCGLTHVGIIVQNKPDENLLFESTSLAVEPCLIKKVISKGVQAHPVTESIEKYDGRVWHYSLYRPLYSHENRRLTQFAIDMIYAPYDMIGALRSAGVILAETESLIHGQDLSSLFCSEFVMAALSLIGAFPTTNASKWSPNSCIRMLRLQGILQKPRRLK